MPVNIPFHRIYRAHVPANNSGYSNWAFIVDKEYAINPHHYTRAFLLLQEDIKRLFEYIEPSDVNLVTFSFRIHELFMRTCIDIESNFKAILNENIYHPVFRRGVNAGQPRNEDLWNINDYSKINKSHHLDNYSIELPFWRGNNNIFKPFQEWKTGTSLSWYQAYNETKHNRNEKFELASFKNLMLSYTALFTLLTAQFKNVDFSPGDEAITAEGNSYFEGEFGIGGYLIIHYPMNWSEEEKYDFDWSNLKEETIRFEKFDYNNL